jgi:hypothetical protein
MEKTINSKKFKKSITFSIPGRSYIYVDLNGKAGTLGNQICAGGSLVGETISYNGDDEKKFEKICRNWWSTYLKKERF